MLEAPNDKQKPLWYILKMKAKLGQYCQARYYIMRVHSVRKNWCGGVSTDPEGQQQLGTESRVSQQTLEILPQLSEIKLAVCHYEGTIRIRMSA